MRKILIPFDFSEVSLNAVQYALDFSDTSDELHVVHVHSGLLSIQSPMMLKAGERYINSIKEEIEATIINNLELNALPSKLKITAIHGEAVHALSRYSRKHLTELAIVGTRDKYDLVDRWIGTISLGLVKSLFIPVYLIPRNASFNGFNKVTVASDHHLGKPQVLHQIKIWNDNHNAFIKFLHVRETIDSNYSDEAKKIVEELYEKEKVDFSFEIATINSMNIGSSLLSAAYNNESDLLIVIAENQSFMNSLLFKSISKELILKSSIPILFLHD
jgi:nucleotide-binding universal stress UspA family protein